MGRGAPSPADQGVWWSVGNGFWRILKATERSFLYLYDEIWEGTICITVPNSNSGGTFPPSPVIYVHG